MNFENIIIWFYVIALPLAAFLLLLTSNREFLTWVTGSYVF